MNKSASELPVATTPIEHYAYLSDCRSGALFGPDGAIDWWCVPRFATAAAYRASLAECGERASDGHAAITGSSR